MARGPAANPIAKRVPWRERPTCAECGMKVRSPRPGDEKRCSRCREVLHISEFPHNSSRADHRESYCRPCKQALQNEAHRSRHRGKAQPISDFSPIGEATSVLIGTFVSQGPLTQYQEITTQLKPVLAEFQTTDRQSVYELTLMPTERPTGTPADSIAVVHAFRELFDAPLEVGDWLAIVYQGGEVAKVIRAGDERPIVDTSLDFTEDEDAPLGARFGSYAPARPWSLGLAIEFVLDWEPPKESGCPICGNERGEIQDFTLSCPSCTRGLRYSAELLLADLVEPEIGFAVLSQLETDWLVAKFPEEVEVPA
jgi:hypothetical protein